MKSIVTLATFSLLLLLSCSNLAFGQDQPSAPVTYTYTAINAPGASGTYAYGINNSGEIVGYITGGQCSQISDQASCGFIDIKNQFTYVACELAGATDFFDVSNTAEVIGAQSFNGGYGAFIWGGNELCNGLSIFGSGMAEAWGVANGNVVGWYIDSASSYQGFLYNGTSGAVTNISCPGWADTRAYGINAAGIIVGDVSNSTSGPFEGMIYKSGKCTTFNYPGAVWTSAKGINKSDEISGWYTDTASVFHGFTKSGNTFTALNYPDSTLTQAYHLNDPGQIAGVYLDTAGAAHGFIATPKK